MAMSPSDPKEIPLYTSRSHITTEGNKTGSWRFLRPRYDEKTAPCGVACPAGEDIARIQMFTSQGLFKEAWETVLFENPFPGVCGRICHHPCESVCNRGRFDEAVAIHTIERFLADTASRYELKAHIERLPARKERIAVAGAGPSGLAAAYFLSLLGYECDVYDEAAEPGGVLLQGVPSYRLPVATLREEVARITASGVRIHCGTRLDQDFLEKVRSTHDAVFMGFGRGRFRGVGIPGEDLPGIDDGFELLRLVAEEKAPAMQGFVAVVGGGYGAIDAARCVVRLGGRAILFFRRKRDEMPASKEGLDMAREEGVDVREGTVPAAIHADGDGFLLTLHADADAAATGGDTETLRVNRVVRAGGADAAAGWMLPPEAGDGVLKLRNTVLVTGPGAPVVFGGDLVNVPGSVVHAVASGKEAAMALDLLFREGPDAVQPGLKRCEVGNGRALSMEIHVHAPRAERSSAVVRYREINTDYFHFAQRITQPRLLKNERTRSFAEIDLRISANLAIREAERCFNCGICNQCDNCRIFCPDLAVMRDESPRGRSINYDYCKGCGVCVVECPRNAMTLEEERGQGEAEDQG